MRRYTYRVYAGKRANLNIQKCVECAAVFSSLQGGMDDSRDQRRLVGKMKILRR